MQRYAIKIHDERHGFVNLLANSISDMIDAFVASKVPHPLVNEGHVILDSESKEEAQRVVARSCDANVAIIDDILGQLQCGHTSHESLDVLQPLKIEVVIV